MTSCCLTWSMLIMHALCGVEHLIMMSVSRNGTGTSHSPKHPVSCADCDGTLLCRYRGAHEQIRSAGERKKCSDRREVKVDTS
jgi:hypothetical protein